MQGKHDTYPQPKYQSRVPPVCVSTNAISNPEPILKDSETWLRDLAGTLPPFFRHPKTNVNDEPAPMVSLFIYSHKDQLITNVYINNTITMDLLAEGEIDGRLPKTWFAKLRKSPPDNPIH